jgi:hypothetical protein
MKSDTPPFTSISDAIVAIEKKRKVTDIQKTAIGVLLKK